MGRLTNASTTLRHSKPKERPPKPSFGKMKQGQKLEHDGIVKCEVFDVGFFGAVFGPLMKITLFANRFAQIDLRESPRLANRRTI